jgi:sec-independent protein translocase protein TatA
MFRNPTTDLIVILVIVLLIFGPKRLPSLGKQLGSGIREFKDGITGKAGGEEDEDDEEPPQLEQASASEAPSASTLTSERDRAQVASSERRS